MNKILACIDGSVYSQSVCDHAVWAALRLGAPLEYLHVMDRHPETAATRDLSGSIGFDSRDSLLSELTLLDEKRSKLAQQHGREMLDRVVRQAREQGVASVEPRLRHGALVDTLTDRYCCCDRRSMSHAGCGHEDSAGGLVRDSGVRPGVGFRYGSFRIAIRKGVLAGCLDLPLL